MKHDPRDGIEQERDELRLLLHALEYVRIPRNMSGDRCPCCWCSPKESGGDGHDAECAIAAALAKFRVEHR